MFYWTTFYSSCIFLFVASFKQDTITNAFFVRSPSYVPYSNRRHSSSLVLQQQLASSVLINTTHYSTVRAEKTTSNGGKRLSRPERKALERQNKERRKQQRKNSYHGKNNFAQRKNELSSKKSDGKEGRYSLNSKAISYLDGNSTANDVIQAIKRAQNLHDTHDIRNIERFLLEQTDKSFAFGYRGSLLSRLAVAALHMNNVDLAKKVINVRREEHRASMLPMESAAIVRGLLRVHDVYGARNILEDELSLPSSRNSTVLSEAANKDRIKHRALSLASIASRHFFEGEPILAISACKNLAEIGPFVREAGITATELNMPWNRIIRGATQCESERRQGTVSMDDNDIANNVVVPCNLVYAVLSAMTTFPSDNNDRVYESLSNALVRRVVFITGAVDMTGCPPADRGEVAFIGRSNVGKSSLINMITNRKSLAYTSKRPGKTKQFNFFAVNDKPGKEREIKYGDVIDNNKDLDSFYIVDLPGFGFAKVSQKQREEWSQFMKEYISTRKTLRVLLHLVDARIGPTEEDKEIMEQVGQQLPSHVTYVVVLTKADKNVKGGNVSKKNQGKVSKDVMNKVREAMNKNQVGRCPVILSSSETKLGRDDLWRFLRLAAEG